MIKANKAFCLTKGDRIEHMPRGTYIEVYNAPPDARFLVSDNIGTHMGFKLHRREVAYESNISISTYRLIGYYAEIRDIEISSLIGYDFRNATEEEIRIIQNNAGLC